ncbi:MAG TPA: hypothetical protein VIG05_06080 [Candidatus Nitrosotenuis sp.]|jgi:hypothetical protein
MALTIEQLRKFAELNMDERCFSIYLHLIEPNIKAMLRDYLRGWQDLETLVTRMTMRSKGAYKTNLEVIFSKGDDMEKFSNEVDLLIYRKVNKLHVDKKIEYLHNIGIFGDSTYALLDFLRLRRNKLHEPEPAFSDVERQAFSSAHSIISWINFVNSTNYPDLEGKKRTLHNCENQAVHLLKWLKEALSDSDQ